MFKKVRISLTVLMSSICFIMLFTMLILFLYDEYVQIFGSAMTEFEENVSELCDVVSENKILSYDIIRNFQNDNKLYAVFYENRELMKISQNYCGQNILEYSENIMKKIQDRRFSKIQGFSLHMEFSAEKIFDNYFYGIILIPGVKNEMEVVVFDPLELENRIFEKKVLRFSVVTFIVFIVLFVCFSLLIKYLMNDIESSQERQRRFISAASHEIRNPVNTIMSAIEAVEKANNEEKSHFFNIVRKEGKRLVLLTEELLTLASNENSKNICNKKECWLDSLLIDCYDAFYSLAIKKGITLEIELPQEKTRSVQVDTEKIKQLISILISNAISFSPEKCIVKLSYSCDDDKHIIAVADDGPGIEDRDKAHIFEPFYRTDNSRKSSTHFGLGLSIAMEIVKLHGGTITIEDNFPCGTVFKIILMSHTKK